MWLRGAVALVTAQFAAVDSLELAAGESVRISSHATTRLEALESSPTDVTQVVRTLNEVMAGIQEEDDKSLSRKRQLKASCADTKRELASALAKANRTAGYAKEDLVSLEAVIRDTEESVAGIHDQITSSSSELDDLQAQLKELRDSKQQEDQEAAATLAQVNGAINMPQKRKHSSKRLEQVQQPDSDLERLSHELAEADSRGDGLSFLQRGTGNTEVLSGDAQALLTARDQNNDEFNEEEARLLDLIRIERKKLDDFEKSLDDQQPVLATKIQEGSEMNQTLVAAKRGIARDAKLLETVKAKCTLLLTYVDAQHGVRHQERNQLQMSSKLLESMDAGSFLAQGLNANAAFVELSVHRTAVHGDGKIDTDDLLAAMTSVTLNDRDSQVSLLGSKAIAATVESGKTGGPFDQVTDVIKGLISTMKQQANEAATKDSFCQNSMAQNRKERLSKKTTIDTQKSVMRAAKAATKRLDQDLAFFKEETQRLGTLSTRAATELEDETARVEEETENHKLARNILGEVSSVLIQLCELPAVSLLQMTLVSSHKRAGGLHEQTNRFDQCGEAVKMIGDARSKFDEQDRGTEAFISSFKELSEKEREDVDTSKAERSQEETAAKASRAQRVDELATAEEDLKAAQKEMFLIQEAKKELDKDCGPGTESHEDRVARREDEIESLKDAYDVLDGEAIPLPSLQSLQAEAKADIQIP